MRMTPEEFAKFVKDDAEKWREVIKFAQISAD
jgi:tripartite-type tricarboxylate transporter receptor subunit TctC